jgi:hypothetical protein
MPCRAHARACRMLTGTERYWWRAQPLRNPRESWQGDFPWSGNFPLSGNLPLALTLVGAVALSFARAGYGDLATGALALSASLALAAKSRFSHTLFWLFSAAGALPRARLPVLAAADPSRTALLEG